MRAQESETMAENGDQTARYLVTVMMCGEHREHETFFVEARVIP